MNKNLFVKTYGCQMNVYDSIKMQELLQSFSYKMVDIVDEADVVILNTCHIRDKAAEKVYSELGRIKKIKVRKPNMIIVVAGCVAQAEGEEIFDRASFVDIVVGPQSYYDLPKLLERVSNYEKNVIRLDFIEDEKFNLLSNNSFIQGVSALISVQEGCNKFCTFCVVPYTRGAEFSRSIEQIYLEVKNSVINGAKEVVLLGQNVNAYHGKSVSGNDSTLSDLITYISEIPSLKRIRYITSHPIDMTNELMDLHGSIPKLMPFLHLPIQSGSNKILKAMNRKHTREYYIEIIENLRRIRKDMVFSSDFIVGFPGETDEDFQDTLDLVSLIGYGQCYSFKYSPRPGTPAAIKKQIPESVKSKRLSVLQEKLSDQQLHCNKSSIGRVMEVLLERQGKISNQLVGKTPYMQTVHINSISSDFLGKIVDVKIVQANLNSLVGEIY